MTHDPISFFFFNDTATTEIYTLSLHDALPISYADAVRRIDGISARLRSGRRPAPRKPAPRRPLAFTSNMSKADFEKMVMQDRKSTRLNSSHVRISYAVFCLKKKTPISGALRST